MNEREFIKKTASMTAEQLVQDLQKEAVMVVREIMCRGENESNRLTAALKIAERSIKTDPTIRHTGKIEFSWMGEDDDENVPPKGSVSRETRADLSAGTIADKSVEKIVDMDKEMLLLKEQSERA